MRRCTVKIVSTTDGEKRVFYKSGTIEHSDDRTELSYEEDFARVVIKTSKQKTLVERNGDYRLSIPLEKGKETFGEIGIGENAGNIAIETDELFVSSSERTFSLKTSYRLKFPNDEQTTHLLLTARF